MKQVIFASFLCLSLTACETPFVTGSDSSATLAVSDEQAAAATDIAAADTETLEIRRKTESTLRHDRIPVSEVIDKDSAIDAIETAETELEERMEQEKAEAEAVKILEPIALAATTTEETSITPTSTESSDTITVANISEAPAVTPAPQPQVDAQPVEIIEETRKQVASVDQPVIDMPSSVQSLSVVLANNKQEMKTKTSGCPKLEIMPVARSLTNFTNNSFSGKMSSRGTIEEVKGGCDLVKGGMEVDLDIIMKGVITNAGRFEGDRGLEAFVTFPYFVSVTSPTGHKVSKDILATAFRFQPNVDKLDHIEKVTHFIEMDDVSLSGDYTITVGYQLSRKQTEYNQAQKVMSVTNDKASADTSPAQKRSTNPLGD